MKGHLRGATRANSIFENGRTTQIRMRLEGERFVLVEGLHRIEAVLRGYLVQAPPR